MIDFLLADILFSILGRAYLFVRFRDKERVRKTLVEKHDNSYITAGRLLTFLFVAWILLIAFTMLIFAAVYGYLRHNIHLFDAG